MAIRVPNLGTGNGQTGDNEFKIRSDYNHNFTEQTNAASRVVGTANNNVPEFSSGSISNSGVAGYCSSLNDYSVRNINQPNLPSGFYYTPTGYQNSQPTDPKLRLAASTHSVILNTSITNDFRSGAQVQFPVRASDQGNVYFRTAWQNEASDWFKFYTTGNTTIESSTNYLKVASPILRLQHNDFEKEHEAEKMDIAVENPSVGVYKITGATGLRNDGTWYFSPPKDEHNNVLCMVEVSEQDDVITVNTYKKKFDFETVSIVPDYDQPTDIPEGAIVMLRFNDLPQDEV